MAIIRELELLDLERDSKHTETRCTYSLVTGSDGRMHLQIDTYGSPQRDFPGKKSQSIRLTPEAIRQRKSIIDKNF